MSSPSAQTPDAFAPTIRKNILRVLEKHIIPALASSEVLQFLAEPPFDFSFLRHQFERQDPLPDQSRSPLQVIQRWEAEHINAVRMPTFGFVYEGVSYERIGMTRSAVDAATARGLAPPAGITVLCVPSPGIICYPPNVPHSDGTPPLTPWPERGSVLGAQILEESVFVFLCGNTTSHSLDIRDPSLVQMGLLYFEELRAGERRPVTQGLLLAFMSRLYRYLTNNHPVIGNTSWIPQRDVNTSISTATAARHHQYCCEAMDYIQTHLHTPLSLSRIASAVGVSGFYLNRIFVHEQGTTVMRYVTQTRIEAAKGILRENPERIRDIAKLVGFASDSTFSAIFRRTTGLSPSEYRRKHRP